MADTKVSRLTGIPGEPMHRPMSLYDQPIRQNRFLSWWFAGCAIRNDLSIDDFLIYWLFFYQARHYSPFPSPFEVVIEQGKPIKIPNPAYDTFWDLSHEGLPSEDVVEHFN